MEVAASSASYDLHEKLNAYRRNGVREYIVWRVWDAAIDWLVLRGGRYEPLPLSDGIFKSEVFPGLWLDPPLRSPGTWPAYWRSSSRASPAPNRPRSWPR